MSNQKQIKMTNQKQIKMSNQKQIKSQKQIKMEIYFSTISFNLAIQNLYMLQRNYLPFFELEKDR